jgi:hypothetical protein
MQQLDSIHTHAEQNVIELDDQKKKVSDPHAISQLSCTRHLMDLMDCS